jgi:tRNA A37 threonylcarbamoyladenosine dehydratase
MTTSPRFDGLNRLYGPAALDRLGAAHVLVVGLGGVGSWTVEALARSGVGALTLVDLDEVCEHNANRQIHAMTGTIGRSKAEVLAERVRAIAPECRVRAVVDFFNASTADVVFDVRYDWVVDAIDHPPNKCLLLDRCRREGVRVATTGGVGGRRDPTKLILGDLNRTIRDPLLRRVRKTLRQKFAWPRTRKKWKIPCVYSAEPAFLPESCEGGASGTLDCDGSYGSVSFVTGAAGFLLAAAVVGDLTGHPLATVSDEGAAAEDDADGPDDGDAPDPIG